MLLPEVVSCQFLTSEALVQSQDRACGIYGQHIQAGYESHDMVKFIVKSYRVIQDHRLDNVKFMG
jgi:hypothetical protein